MTWLYFMMASFRVMKNSRLKRRLSSQFDSVNTLSIRRSGRGGGGERKGRIKESRNT